MRKLIPHIGAERRSTRAGRQRRRNATECSILENLRSNRKGRSRNFHFQTAAPRICLRYHEPHVKNLPTLTKALRNLMPTDVKDKVKNGKEKDEVKKTKDKNKENGEGKNATKSKKNTRKDPIGEDADDSDGEPE